MKIHEHINHFNFENFAEVDQLLATAQIKTTFFASRVLKFEGYEGSISIDKVTLKVYKAAKHRFERNNFNMQDRVSGLDVMHRLRNFYTASDDEMAKSNVLTRLINCIKQWIQSYSISARDLTHQSYGTFYNIMVDTAPRGFKGMGAYFRVYELSNFIEEFGDQKRSNGIDYLHSEGRKENEILANEKSMRDKLKLQT